MDNTGGYLYVGLGNCTFYQAQNITGNFEGGFFADLDFDGTNTLLLTRRAARFMDALRLWCLLHREHYRLFSQPGHYYGRPN